MLVTPPIISATFSKGRNSFAPHFHNCHEIIFVSRGSMRMKVGDSDYTVTAPSICFISNLEHHSITALGDDYERYCVQVSPSAIRFVIKNNIVCSIFSNRPDGFCHVIEIADMYKTVENIFDMMVDEYGESPVFSDDVQKSLLRLLLISLYRNHPDSFPLKVTAKNNIVEGIQREFENDYAKEYSLEILAERHHVSKGYLSHLFKETTGYGVMQYLSEQRLSIAKDLLCATNMSAAKIAEETGFSTGGNFSRFLKNATGMTPREYRNHHKRRMK